MAPRSGSAPGARSGSAATAAAKAPPSGRPANGGRAPQAVAPTSSRAAAPSSKAPPSSRTAQPVATTPAPPKVAAPAAAAATPAPAAPVKSDGPAQFKVGDKAVYPRGGVAEVIGIEELDIAGHRQSFYVLKLLQNNSKIRVPVGNESTVGLRQLISEQEILEVFDILRERTIAFDKQTWNRRFRGFMDKIKTGSIYDVAEVLRDLYRLKTDKQLSFGEKRMLDEARSLIVKEIAIARGHTEDAVKNEIEAIFLAN